FLKERYRYRTPSFEGSNSLDREILWPAADNKDKPDLLRRMHPGAKIREEHSAGTTVLGTAQDIEFVQEEHEFFSSERLYDRRQKDIGKVLTIGVERRWRRVGGVPP